MARRVVDTRLGQALKQPIQRMLGRAGWELRRWEPHDSASLLPALLRRHRVATVLDVGANVGQYATRLRQSGFEGRILSFEPNPEAFARLERAAKRDPLWRCVQVAAGDKRDELTLEVSQNSTSSSLFPISDRHLQAAPASEVANRVSVPVEPIDAVVEAYGDLQWPYLLKLDVQGFEIAAIAGAHGLLARTPIVTAELSFVELFEGGARYLEVLSVLAGSGYVPVDLQPGFRDPMSGELLQCDVTLVRDTR